MSIGSFKHTGNDVKEQCMHASWLEFCIVFSHIIFQAMPVENVWPPCSKSACAQVSTALLRPDHYICVGMDLYRRYLDFSPTSKGSAMLSQSKHWFQQSPGLPDLLRYPCVIKVVEGIYRKPAHGIHRLPIYVALEKTTFDSYTYCEIFC